MRLIDADALIKKWENVHSKDVSFEMAIIGATNDIKKAQTVDAMPVIRCKDCRHYHPNAKNTVMNCRNSHGLLHATADDYCSKAERK